MPFQFLFGFFTRAWRIGDVFGDFRVTIKCPKVIQV